MEAVPPTSDAGSTGCAAGVMSASASADALVGVAWTDVAEADLVATMAELARAQRLLDHAKLEIARRLEASDAAAAHGWASAKDFLTAVSGGDKGAGSGLLRLARRLEERPATRAAMAAGRLSRAQAEVISRGVARLPRVPDLRDGVEARLLDAARDLDATDLDRSFTTAVAELDPDGTVRRGDLSLPRRERAAHSQRYLAFTRDAYGGVRIRGYATAEEAELVTSTLVPLSAPVQTEPGACGGSPHTIGDRGSRQSCPDPACGHDGRDPREFGVRLWDALVEACARLQTTDLLPQSHGASPRLVVTVGFDDLRPAPSAPTDPSDSSGPSGGAEARGTLPGGDEISVSAARRLACDAEIIPAVLGSAGQVLDLGRSQRLVTPALWQALVLRDCHCAFPGCSRLPISCDAHHIVHWADGGATSLDNLVLLCRRHHTLTHHSPWAVRIDPERHRPVWTPPPRADDAGRFTYLPGRAA